MADEKKYKYTVKKFAKMLTVHPDKRVTFQDNVDLRTFIVPLTVSMNSTSFNTLTDLVGAVVFDDARVWTAERNEYWPTLVEHGELLTIANEQFDSPPVSLVGVHGPFTVRVEFSLNPDKVAAWLAATGFPQMSRAKEEPNADTPVAE